MDTFALVVGWLRVVCARRRAKGFGQSKLGRKFGCVHGKVLYFTRAGHIKLLVLVLLKILFY